MPSHSKARSIPRIAFYDEIWAKKECEKLKLERLGYSCKDLRDQEDIITKPDFSEKPG